MRGLSVLRTLGPIDARSIRRDSLLGWMLVMPIAVGLLVRFATPPVTTWLQRDFGFDLVPYYPLVMSYFIVIMVPMLVGLVIGFLLIEERDDRTLTALLVTPLRLDDYLRYRIGLPLLVGSAVTLLAFAIGRLVPVAAWFVPEPWQYLAGLALQLAMLWALLCRFHRVAYR